MAERRREILSAAEKVFDAHGYAAATVDAVAEAAGVSKGSMYNYFENKRDLFTQVFAEAIAGEEDTTERMISEDLPASVKLERMLDEWFDRLGYYRKIGRLVLEFWATAAREDQDGELASWFNGMYVRWQDQIGRIIEQGIASGEFRADINTSVAAALIHAVIDGITVQIIMSMDLKIDEDFIAAMKRSILTALTAPGAQDTPRS
jgi:AcrR family transcriptional regulator